jgi:hypothetical protein
VTEEYETLAHDAETLAAVFARSTDRDHEALARFADLLSELPPLDSEALDALSRSLQVSGNIAERWFEQTARFLQSAHQMAPDDPRWSVVVEHLSLLSWAWGDVPTEWPQELADTLLDGWAAEIAEQRDPETSTAEPAEATP